MTIVATSVFLLVISSLVGVLACLHLGRRGGDGMRLRLWMMINMVVAYHLSGFAHVLRLSHDRGFYEALAGAPSGSSSGLMAASVSTLLGTCALWAGLSLRPLGGRTPRRGREIEHSWLTGHRRLAAGAGVFLLLASAYALYKVISVTSSSDSTRIISVSGGNARYVFLSDWFPFAVSLLALVLWSKGTRARDDARNAVMLVLALGMIGGSQAWSGGRSSVLFACFPLLVMLLPRLRRGTRYLLLVLGVVTISAYVWIQTVARASAPGGGGSTDGWGLLDWQWGRFSMAAWARNYVAHSGYVDGSTYLSGLVVVPLSIAHFAGIDISSPWTPVVGLTGQSLLGSADQIYIVPGSMAEMFVNFGYPGVVVGYLVMGASTALLADLFRNSRGEVQRLLVAMIASTLLGQMVFQFEAFFQGVIMTCLPAWVLAFVEWRQSRQEASDTRSRPRLSRLRANRAPTTSATRSALGIISPR